MHVKLEFTDAKNNPASIPNMNSGFVHVSCARYARLRAHMHVKLEFTDAKNNPASIPNMNSGFVHVSCARYARLRAQLHAKCKKFFGFGQVGRLLCTSPQTGLSVPRLD